MKRRKKSQPRQWTFTQLFIIAMLAWMLTFTVAQIVLLGF